MTWGNPPPFIAKQLKKAKAVTPEDLAKSGSEDGAQAALFCWAALSVGKYPALKWLYAIPNGGFKHIAEAAKFVATGTRAGVPDICLPCSMRKWGPEVTYCGCYIELKKAKRRTEKNGGCTQEQLDYLEYLTSAGYYCKVCYSWEEARDVLINYLEGKL